MGIETIIAIIGILVSIGTYFAGRIHGERLERARQEHEWKIEKERQNHDIRLEKVRREQELASKVADEYVDMARRRYDSGLSALTKLGLETLGSDHLIRQAIHDMKVRSNIDPWNGKCHLIDDIDLVVFFRFVRERRIDFFTTSLETVANQVRSETASNAKTGGN